MDQNHQRTRLTMTHIATKTTSIDTIINKVFSNEIASNAEVINTVGKLLTKSPEVNRVALRCDALNDHVSTLLLIAIEASLASKLTALCHQLIDLAINTIELHGSRQTDTLTNHMLDNILSKCIEYKSITSAKHLVLHPSNALNRPFNRLGTMPRDTEHVSLAIKLMPQRHAAVLIGHISTQSHLSVEYLSKAALQSLKLDKLILTQALFELGALPSSFSLHDYDCAYPQGAEHALLNLSRPKAHIAPYLIDYYMQTANASLATYIRKAPQWQRQSLFSNLV